ncbi:MAG TPA: energy transducer TonB [Candidatus Polarisedimenticolia bacterium]|jgi:TonB family protein
MTIKLKIAWGERSEQILMKMAGYSAVAHLVALIVFSMIPRFTTPPPMPRTAIAEIIPASALFPPAPPGGPAHARQAEPTPSERAEAAKVAEKPPAPKPPEAPKAPKKKPDATVPPPPGEKRAEKPRPEPEPERAAERAGRDQVEPPPVADSMAGISLGGTVVPGGIPSIGSSAFPYDYYRSSLVAILQSNWRRPVAPEGLREPVSCRVQFTILKSGIIQDARISVPSGNEALDQSALRAIYDSNPLPPLPFQYGQNSVSAEVLFELTAD